MHDASASRRDPPEGLRDLPRREPALDLTNQQLTTLALAADQAARRALRQGNVAESEAHAREVARLLGMMR